MRFLLAFALILLVAWAAPVSAQERLCTLNTAGRTEGVGNQVILVHDPFTVRCQDGAYLRANSGRLDQNTSEMYLTGDVFFEDDGRTLESREATYNRTTGRLWAVGDVVFVNRVEGSTLRGPELEYFRAIPGRPVEEVHAPRRPELTINSDDPENPDPMVVVADRLHIVGDDDLSAFGEVVVTRPDLNARSAEARYNSTTEELELRGEAEVLYDQYTLAGDLIRAELTEGSLEHVHSRTRARLEGDDLHVAAPDLQLFFAADTLRRAVAVAGEESPGVQALARSGTFELVADSIDATLIAQKIREVHAIGSARAETRDTAAPAILPDAVGPPDPTATDSLPPPATAPAAATGLLTSDWVRGDTVIGYFEPVPPSDSIALDVTAAEAPDEVAPADGDVELKRLVAIGSAQSLYRMAPEGQPDTARRNVNFLVGARIELDLQDGELSVATVKGLERGVYLEASAEDVPPPGPPPPALPEGDGDGAAPSNPGSV